MNSLIYPKLKIEGRSGCFLELKSTDSNVIVRKTSIGKEYNKRLFRQTEKQKQFIDKKIYPPNFYTPNIISTSELKNEESYWFEMEYIPGESYSTFIQKCTIKELNSLGENLIEFIEKELKHSRDSLVAKGIMLSKLEEVKISINKNKITDRIIDHSIKGLMSEITDLFHPVGYCHGDLTFSNMIFNSGNIFLVDFLDSFIESPLIDIVKLRQDTKFYWSLFIDKDSHNYQVSKIIQAFRYLDKRIHEHFFQYLFYRDYYNLFEKMNLLRILPYLKNKKEIQFVINCLKQKEI